MRKVQDLSRHMRKATPLPFARYLLAEVMRREHVERVATLWVEPHTVYHKLYPLVDIWGPARDAQKYDGPYPIIAHPPCGPWGVLAWISQESKDHGILAMYLVHKWGGVVEQPSGSQLFRLYGSPGAEIQRVNQCDYGHVAQKATILYWWKAGT